MLSARCSSRSAHGSSVCMQVMFCTALGREERAALLAAMAACEAATPMPAAVVERSLNTSNPQVWLALQIEMRWL